MQFLQRPFDVLQRASHNVRVQAYAGGQSHRLYLLQAIDDYPPPLRSGHQLGQGFPGQAGYAGHGGDEQEFAPQRLVNVQAEPGRYAGLLQGSLQCWPSLRIAAARLPKLDAHHVTRLGYQTWFRVSGLNVSGPGHDYFRSHHIGGGLVAIDTVLQAQHQRIGADHGQHGRDCHRIMVGLDRQEDQVNHPHLPRGVGGLAVDGEVIPVGYDSQALLLNRRQVRASGNQGDIMPASGQHAAEISADCAGSHDRNPHESSLSGQ